MPYSNTPTKKYRAPVDGLGNSRYAAGESRLKRSLQSGQAFTCLASTPEAFLKCGTRLNRGKVLSNLGFKHLRPEILRAVELWPSVLIRETT